MIESCSLLSWCQIVKTHDWQPQRDCSHQNLETSESWRQKLKTARGPVENELGNTFSLQC